jgi:hypothetical protein
MITVKLSNIRPENLDQYQERFEALEREGGEYGDSMYGLLELAIKIGLLVLESGFVLPPQVEI